MPDILIADDHSAARLGLALLVRKALGASCNIDFAESGSEVLQKIQEKNYHLLLSDLLMPDQLGFSLIGQVLAQQKDLGIIIVSVGPEQYFADRCLKAGALAYICKSVTDDMFIEVIMSVYKEYII